MSAFDIAYKNLELAEGLYSNDPQDPGGETWKGIARNRHPSWSGWLDIDREKHYTAQPYLERILAADTKLEQAVQDFYRSRFWESIWGDKIALVSIPLATDLFEMSVNIGAARATEFLQRALNVLNRGAELYDDIPVDGLFGSRTMKAVYDCVRTRGVETLYKLVNVLQGAYYVDLAVSRPVFEKYLAGWLKRVNF